MMNVNLRGGHVNHQQYKEWLQLSMYDELTAEEQKLLEQHLRDCASCRRDAEELNLLHWTLQKAGRFHLSENALLDARQELRLALRAERTKPSVWERLSGFFAVSILPNYRVALGGAAMLLAGLVVGRYALTPATPTALQSTQEATFTSSFDGEPRISNIRFIDSDASDGEVEFSFEAVSPVHVKGNINDERVQKVLAHALVNDQNPGVRLRTVNAIASQGERLRIPDREIRAALILAVKTDENPGVRKEALKTLRSFPFDEEIKQAFLYVLMKDKNPALRIEAINSLDSARTRVVDKELMDVLTQRMQSDENSYVRIRAKAVLEEVKNQ